MLISFVEVADYVDIVGSEVFVGVVFDVVFVDVVSDTVVEFVAHVVFVLAGCDIVLPVFAVSFVLFVLWSFYLVVAVTAARR